jgi:hypothetical protein
MLAESIAFKKNRIFTYFIEGMKVCILTSCLKAELKYLQSSPACHGRPRKGTDFLGYNWSPLSVEAYKYRDLFLKVGG